MVSKHAVTNPPIIEFTRAVRNDGVGASTIDSRTSEVSVTAVFREGVTATVGVQ